MIDSIKSKSIKLKDLQNRVYSGKQCIAFNLVLENKELENSEQLILQYVRNVNDLTLWNVRLILERKTIYENTTIYDIGYSAYSINIDLVKVAMIGLTYLQTEIKQELQRKINIDFMVGEVLN